MKTTYSPGALRAATLHYYGQLLPDNCLSDEALCLAALIDRETSAPAMRDALEKMLRIAELADSHHSEDVCDAIDQARAALALATQESK